MSATSTIIFSAPAALKGSHVEFTTSFRPPQNIRGRSCYLKVTNCTVTAADNAPLLPFKTYFVTMDLPQSSSFASINSHVTQVTPTDGSLVSSLGPNRVVHCFSTGGHIVVGAAPVFYSGMQSSQSPRILVEIPNGPQDVTVGLYLAKGAIALAEYSNLTIMFEVTPIDSGERLDLSI